MSAPVVLYSFSGVALFFFFIYIYILAFSLEGRVVFVVVPFVFI